MGNEMSAARHVPKPRRRREVEVVRVVDPATGTEAPDIAGVHVQLRPSTHADDWVARGRERLTDAAAAEAAKRLTGESFSAQLEHRPGREDVTCDRFTAGRVAAHPADVRAAS